MNDISRGFDVDSYNKPNFNFDAAFNEGYGTAIVKLGGNNLSGNQPYRMNGYSDFANKQAKFPIRGAYWVTGGNDPVRAATFYAQNRAPWTNLDILDNEKLDSGNPWNDGQACAFWDTLASFNLPNYNPWQYGSRDALWKSVGPWPGSQARNIKALIAFYNGAPLSNINPGNYPASLVKGHQWSSSATIGGSGNIDANAFTADAFVPSVQELGDMAFDSFYADGRWVGFFDELGSDNVAEYMTPDIGLDEFLQSMRAAWGDSKKLTPRQFDIVNAIAQRRHSQKLAELASQAADPAVIAPALAEALLKAGIGGTTPDQIKQITDAVAEAQRAVVAAIPDTFVAEKAAS